MFFPEAKPGEQVENLRDEGKTKRGVEKGDGERKVANKVKGALSNKSPLEQLELHPTEETWVPM